MPQGDPSHRPSFLYARTRIDTSTTPSDEPNVDELTKHPGRLARPSPSPASSRNQQTPRPRDLDHDGIMDSTTLTGGTFATSSAAVTADMGATYYQMATAPNATTTIAITNALKFAQSKSVRTSTIILASFNSLAAFATAVGIIYGCRQYRQRMQRRASGPSVKQYEWRVSSQLTPSRPSGLSYIHTAEVFPLLLCVGITVQSITFAAAQSVGLQALLSRGCTLVAIFMLPGEFSWPPTASQQEALDANMICSRLYRSFYSSSLRHRGRRPRRTHTVRAPGKMECEHMLRRSSHLGRCGFRRGRRRQGAGFLLRIPILVSEDIRAWMLRGVPLHFDHSFNRYWGHFRELEQESLGGSYRARGSFEDDLLSGSWVHLECELLAPSVTL